MEPVGIVQKTDGTAVASFSCAVCQEFTCVSFSHGSGNTDWIRSVPGEFTDVGRKMYTLRIRQYYPKATSLIAPSGTSAGVTRAFVQGLDNASRGHSDAAASMFRKALDIATRDLDVSFVGKNLATRIDLLAKAGRLTEDLKEWAHLIRLDGNQGAHDDDELTAKEIAQLRDFTELFLTYTFTLPAQVEARKAESGKAGK